MRWQQLSTISALALCDGQAITFAPCTCVDHVRSYERCTGRARTHRLSVTGLTAHDLAPLNSVGPEADSLFYVTDMSCAAQVQQYILVTADHHHLDGDNDCDIFVDADLSILVSTDCAPCYKCMHQTSCTLVMLTG